MYRRIAFAAAALSLATGGMLGIWAWLRPYADLQRQYGATLGIAGLLVGGLLLAGALSIPASAGRVTWRRLGPRWPVILGVVGIVLITAGVGMAAAAAITSPDLDPQTGPTRVPGPQPASDTLPQRPPR
jgi:hypothetical protein